MDSFSDWLQVFFVDNEVVIGVDGPVTTGVLTPFGKLGVVGKTADA